MDMDTKENRYELLEVPVAGYASSPQKEVYGYEIRVRAASDEKDMQRLGKKQ